MATEKVVRRFAGLTEWERTCSPPQNKEVCCYCAYAYVPTYKCECVRHIVVNTFVQFLEEFNEMWRTFLDEIIWEFNYQIKFVLDDKKEVKEPQQKTVYITYAV